MTNFKFLSFRGRSPLARRPLGTPITEGEKSLPFKKHYQRFDYITYYSIKKVFAKQKTMLY